jgi:hypothetical protein
MRSLALACVLGVGLAAVAAPPQPGEEKPPFAVHEVRPDQGKLGPLLVAEAQFAKKRGLKLFVEIGASWCRPCQQLKKAIATRHPLIIDALKGADVIQLDLDEWEAQLQDAGLSSKAVPVFFALDEKGKPTGRTIDGGAWGADTPENMAPPLKAFFSKR